jgi:hypothetical protein
MTDNTDVTGAAPFSSMGIGGRGPLFYLEALIEHTFALWYDTEEMGE